MQLSSVRKIFWRSKINKGVSFVVATLKENSDFTKISEWITRGPIFNPDWRHLFILLFLFNIKLLSSDVDYCYLDNPCSVNAKCSNDIDEMQAVCDCNPGYGGETCQCK